MKILVCACLLLFSVTMLPEQKFKVDIFPSTVRGWTLSAAVDSYTPENLYEYIDGASELYISYGFTKLISRKYEKPGQPEIVVDFFDMGSSDNAFGIFVHFNIIGGF